MDGTGLKEESTPHDAPPLQLALREAAALMIRMTPTGYLRGWTVGRVSSTCALHSNPSRPAPSLMIGRVECTTPRAGSQMCGPTFLYSYTVY